MRISRSRGMTLVEVLVASVLLGIGVAGLMSTATLAMRNQQKVEQRSKALCLAQEKMSEIDMIGPHTWLLGRPMSGNEARENIEFDWTIEIEQMLDADLFDVRVEVDWSSPSGTGSVDLETRLNDFEARALTVKQNRDEVNLNEVNPTPQQ